MEKRDVTSGIPGDGVATERHRTPHGSVEFRRHASDLMVELRGHSAQDIFRLAAWALARIQAPELTGEAVAEDKTSS
jgi:hypothetical protein